MFGIILGCKEKPEKDSTHFIHCLKPGSVLKIVISEQLKPNEFYWKYIGIVKTVDLQSTSGKTLIRIRKLDSLGPLQLSDEVYSRQVPIEFTMPLNPGAFDYREYMNKKAIYHHLTLNGFENIISKPKYFSIRHSSLKIRDQISLSLRNKGFSKKEFSIIQALLLGQKKGLSEETKLSYQHAGAMHILAISGLHIGIVLMLLNTLLKPIVYLKFGKELKCILLLAALWCFAFISGLSSSVIRATSMFSLLTIGAQFGRTSQISNFLFLALFFSLLFKPLIIFDLGFQLSYTAVFGIIGMTPLFNTTWIPTSRVGKYFWNLICVSVAAQLAVLPLSLYYFHHFSALFLVSSICIIPFLGVVLGLGYLMLILDQLSWLGEDYISLYESLIRGMNVLVEGIGSVDHLNFHGIFFSLPLLLLGYFLVICFYYWMKSRALLQTVGLLLVALLFSALLLHKKWSIQKSDEFVVFHQFRNSLLLRRHGDKAVLFANDTVENAAQNRTIQEYEINFLDLHVARSDLNRNFFSLGKDRIMIVDDPIILTGYDPDLLVLRNSPKINLERLLGKIKPKTIIADGSNFSSFKYHWEKTAKKQGVLFHDTAKNGAFTLEIGSR